MAKRIPHNQLTVVVAGASSGIGKGVVRRLAAEEANLVIGARRTELIEELAKECGPNTAAVTMDIGKEEDVKRLYEAAIEKFGRIDVWINVAGVGLIGSFTELPTADMKRIVETNVLGTMYGSQYALRQFKGQKSGILINLGSISAKVPFPYYSSYSATKYAVTGLSSALRLEMELEGYDDIHVCIVHPWATDTPWFDHSANYSGHEAQMKPMDDPENVVDAIMGLIDKPQESVEVGAKSKGSTISSNLMPKTTETLNAKYLKSVIEDAPPAPHTSGSLHAAMPSGTEVTADMRERMKKQQEEKK